MSTRASVSLRDFIGERGFPGLIPRNSALVFDLELITFN